MNIVLDTLHFLKKISQGFGAKCLITFQKPSEANDSCYYNDGAND